MDSDLKPHNLITLTESKTLLANIFEKFEDDFLWLEDILTECKKTFATACIQLLPKTPARKKQTRKHRHVTEENDEEADGSFMVVRTLTFDQQSHKLRPRAPTVSSSTRVTRSAKAAAKKEEKENTAPQPILDLMKMAGAILPGAEGEGKKTEQSSSSAHESVYSVRQRAQAYEAMLSCRVSSSPVVSPHAASMKVREVRESPIESADSTQDIRRSSATSRFSSCTRKSLKVLASKAKLRSLHGQPSHPRPRSSICQPTSMLDQELQLIPDKSDDTTKVRTHVTEVQAKTSRTRLRLNKAKTMSDNDSSSSTTTYTSEDPTQDVLEKQTIPRGNDKTNKYPESFHERTKRKQASGSSGDEVAATQHACSPSTASQMGTRMRTRTKVRKIEKQEDVVEVEESMFESPHKACAVSTAPDSGSGSNTDMGCCDRKNTETSSPINASSADDSGLSCPNICTNAQVISENLENEDTTSKEDVLSATPARRSKHEEKYSFTIPVENKENSLEKTENLRRATHVLVKNEVAVQEEEPRKEMVVSPPASANPDGGQCETEPKHVEETRMTRTKARKRQAEEEANVSVSKKLCTASPSATNQADLESSSPFQDGKEEDEMDVDDDSDYEDLEPENPPNKHIIRPHSFLANMRKSSLSRSTSLISGVVTSFLKRNTPPHKPTFKVLQQQKKKELQEKERREQERLSRIDEMKKNKVEEQKRKREERMRKVAEMRELRQQKENNLKKSLQEKLQEKLNSTDRMKEDRFKEEREKQRQRLKKQLEAEERRRLEDEERMRKFLEQQEEKRRHEEFLQRKREHEEQERQQRLKEERRRLEEKQAELERERLAERERLRQQELEREREQQKLKEQKEKAAAEERAARERQEMEKKKEREAKLQREFEKLKELEQQRLAKMAAMEEEKRKEEARLNQIIQHHNRNMQNILANINCTVSLSKPTESHSVHNPDSYPITPRHIKKKSSSLETYDIADLCSDDSTDDDQAPRKKIPSWAQGSNFKAALINQEHHPPDLDAIFTYIEPPDLNEMFKVKRPRFNKRTSSAVWHSPLHKPL